MPRKRADPPSSILLPKNRAGVVRRRYTGASEKLVVAIDVGTTFSAVSFCILRPGCTGEPQLEMVSAWPGQSLSDSKVPSTLFYDANGNVMAWGAETTDPDTRAKAEQNGWETVRWFKLDLRPPHLPALIWPNTENPSQEPEARLSLPVQNVEKAVNAYTTYLQFIFEHLRAYFCKHHGDGEARWNTLFPTLEIIFTIPNGWEFRQHHLIREAAVTVGFMGADMIKGQEEAWDRIRFVSEAEAAMIYAADTGNVDSWLQVGKDVILCDAGGGTIDITAYTVEKIYPLELKEKMAPKCVIAGAVFINEAARLYLQNKLRGTEWDTPSFIEELMEEFERDTKKRFGNNLNLNELGIGRFGPSKPKDLKNIRDGRFYIPKNDMIAFFDNTLTAIENNILDIYKESGRTATNIIMVGGLLNSSYAYTQLERWGKRHNFIFTKPDGVMAKTVSHGALLWYLSKPVKGYISKVHYGSDVSIPVGEMQEDTEGRKTVMRADGAYIYEGIWQSIAPMGRELPPKGAVQPFEMLFDQYDSETDLILKEKIYVHRGEQIPKFMKDRLTALMLPEFEHVCTIVADLRKQYNMTPWTEPNAHGKKFKTLEFDITITHDGYDLKAFSSWKLGRSKYTGEAKIIQPPQ